MGEEQRHGRLAYFFATHPYPEKRVRSLELTIEEKGYAVLETKPLDRAFLK
jgi:hypothetical protein